MVSTETAKFESAQALFCYIADVVGSGQIDKKWDPYIKNIANNKYKDDNGPKYEDFIKDPIHAKAIREAFSSPVVDISPWKVEQIHDFLNETKLPNPIQKGWFLSSLKIGQKLIKDLATATSGPEFNLNALTRKISAKGAGRVSYLRGDGDVMESIATLFQRANLNTQRKKMVYFGKIEKWNPADIYYATDKAKTELKSLVNKPNTKNISFPELNGYIIKLMKDGHLLPLSLKKGVHDIKIKRVNFQRNEEQERIEKTFCTGVRAGGVTGVTMKSSPKKFSFINKDKKKGSRDVIIKLISGNLKGQLQIRHTPGKGGRPQRGVKIVLSYTGASALAGQVTTIPRFCIIFDTIAPSFASGVYSRFFNNYPTFETAMNRYRDDKGGGGDILYKLGKKNGQYSKESKQFNDDIGIISALTIMNKLIPYIATFFKASVGNPEHVAHQVLRAVFEYVSSRTVHSSPFVIAKD